MPRSFDSVFYGAAGTDTDTGPPDDEFNRTSFLSHFDGTNNGVNSVFDDGSASNHTITANGDVTQGSFGPFARPDGEWGVAMPTGPIIQNSYAGSVEVASHSDFTLSGQYTIEFFVNSRTLKTPGVTTTVGLFALGNEYVANSMNLFNTGTTFKYWNSSQYKTFGSSSDFVTNSWVHIAVCRNSSNVITCFVNGTALGTTFSDTTTPQGQVVIGAEFYQNARYNSLVGSISNFRILNGTCLYTSNFTAPTSALTAITNTKLLTCQSNRFVDNSASGHTVTVTGAPEVSAFGPFLTSAVYSAGTNGASMECDGDGDYLSLAYDADFNFGTGSFTIEAFVFPKDLSGAQGIYATNGGSGSSPKFIIYLDGTTPKAHVNGFGSSVFFNATATISANEWNHLAFVRNGSTWYWFVNGTQAGTGSNSTNITFNNVATVVGYGGESGNAPINGFISDLRVVKGTAVYTSNFTPPTAPISAITNTKLLLKMADGQAIDSAAQNNLTLVGNAKISTGQAKFGDTSMVFDGTGDYVTLPSDSFTPFGTGDFTIECFARFDAISGQGVFQLGASYLPSAVTGPAVFGTSDGGSARWRMYYATSYADNTSNPPSTNTWFHIAFVRASGVSKVYIDGVEVLSENDTTNYTNKFFVIGGAYSSSFLMDGYIDDFRISHFARYTSNNFTPPSAAFPDKGQ